jgi:hypothetical protein
MKADGVKDGVRHEDIETMRRIGDVASERLEQGPDPRVRVAVLAAAARAVDAKPRDVDRIGRTPFSARHWPLSAAALLVVSVATGLLATRVLRDEPERVTTVASVRETKPPEPVASIVAANAPAAESSAPQAKAERSATARPVRPSSRLRSADADATTSTARRGDLAEGQAPRPEASGDSFVAQPPSAQTIAAPSSPTVQQGRSNEIRDKVEARPPFADAPPLARTAAAAPMSRFRSASEPTTPEAWVERIVRMRIDGDDVGADRELDALRRRYPDFVIPPAALGPAGTR